MTNEKRCANCGQINPPNANFCSACGSNLFTEAPSQPPGPVPSTAVSGINVAVNLSLARVILLTVISSGLYLLYWFYLTWKQIRDETGRKHYPVWHALTLIVPIYNWFRLHAHVRTTNEVASGAGVTASLTAGVAVVMFIVGNVLDFVGIWSSEVVSLVLTLINLGLVTSIIMLTQNTLNLYWQRTRGSRLQEAPLGVGEVIFTLLGILIWVGNIAW